MTYYSTLRTYRFTEDQANDIRGARIYGIGDEKLGKIDDVIFDSATGDIRYVIIDTGGWLSSKRFIVPADKLYDSVKHEDDFSVNLTKAQIESFPPYDEDAVDTTENWSTYETKYQSRWPSTVRYERGTRSPLVSIRATSAQ